MKRKLGDISKIHFGPYLKGDENGEVKYLLASHFDNFYKPTKFELSFIDIDEVNSDELLKTNDVILAGKGQRTFAWAYEDEMGACVPSSLFFVLETESNKVIGKYLALYLNSERVQHKLKLIGGGLTVPSIPKKELEKLDVYIPSIAEQKKIIDLASLLDDDIGLVEQMLERKKAMRRTILNKMINNQIQNKRT